MAAVLFETRTTADNKKIIIATLNAERKLNALSMDMLDLLLPALQQWQEDDAVVCVLLKGAGSKAFCAGGDIKQLYEQLVSTSECEAMALADEYFYKEYSTDYVIHQFQKPLIVWGNGIVMGGGMGLMAGASHRVVTESTRMAMPEISIGLYPDVGAGWFLPRAPGRAGLFLGLTGVSFNAADALFLGLADCFLSTDSLDAIIADLVAESWQPVESHQALVSRVLCHHQDLSGLPAANVEPRFELIQTVTEAEDLQTLVMKIHAAGGDDKWWQQAQSLLNQGCPVTAHLAYEQYYRAQQLSLEEVFTMELALSAQCMRHPDFQEGVRALLVDKDGAPAWRYQSIAEVPADYIEAHFKLPDNFACDVDAFLKKPSL